MIRESTDANAGAGADTVAIVPESAGTLALELARNDSPNMRPVPLAVVTTP